MSKYQSFVQTNSPIPERQLAWPLFGTGIEFLGKEGKPIEQAVPRFGADELLMRVDAVSMCFTDVKEIMQGENHPRLIGRNLVEDPIIPGHELSMTVIGVGKHLEGEYKVGDRFTIQPDVWVDGKSRPFCFDLDGGYRQYARIGKEVMGGDAGNYLIPITKDMVYAAAAITEPWACVEAAYRANYRNHVLKGGVMWIVGGERARRGYLPEALFKTSLPSSLLITDLPTKLKEKVVAICQSQGVVFDEISLESALTSEAVYDDIVCLDCRAETITRVSEKLANGGIFVMFGGDDPTTIDIDLGRIHYDDIYFAGSDSLDLNKGYTRTTPRADHLPGGKMWIVGAGGPMGRMHLQRAIEATDGPNLIVASEVTQDRYEALKEFFLPMARKHYKELLIINAKEDPDLSREVLDQVKDQGGFDDIEIMVAIIPVIMETLPYAAKMGVISLFAGLKRGVMMSVDPCLIRGPQQVRFVGHSGSGLDDQIAVVNKMLSGELRPELSVAAVGGMMQVVEGIIAMQAWQYPGKIVIYPHVIDFPLTAMLEFKEKSPEVYAVLGEGMTWSKEAEEIFLDKELA